MHMYMCIYMYMYNHKCQEKDIQQCCITSMVYRIVSSEFVAHDMVYSSSQNNVYVHRFVERND